MPRSSVTLGEAVDLFLQLRQADLAPETLRAYTQTLNMFSRRTGRDLGIKSLTPRHMEEYFITGHHARADRVAPNTYNKERIMLVSFVRFTAGRGWTPISLMDTIRIRRPAKRHRLLLSPTEMMSALDMQSHPRDRAIIALGLNTALRSSEIASLTIQSVDLNNGWLYTTLHKNRKTDRFPISEDLDTEMRCWLRWYTAKVGPLADDYRLIPARVTPDAAREGGRETNGKLRSDPEGDVMPRLSAIYHIRTPVHRALRQLGYPTHGEGLHTLRRSVARAYYDMLVQQGCDDPLRVTQQMLNHESAITTEHYIGVETERKKRDESLRGKPFLSTLLNKENLLPFQSVAGGERGA